jgi:hypothetical protein
VRHHIRGDKLTGLHVIPSVGIDQQIDAGILVLPDQINDLGDGAGKAAQRSVRGQPLVLRRYSSVASDKQPELDKSLFDLLAIAARRVAMAAPHRQVMQYPRTENRTRP